MPIGPLMFDWQGHRGCRGLMPENTIPAMFNALEYGVRTLEIDVVITSDQRVLVSHEAYFNHEISTKPNGKHVTEEEEMLLNIYQMDFGDVIKYDVGLKSHPRFPQQQKRAAVKPLLVDLMSATDEYAIANKQSLPYYNIELKAGALTDHIYHPKPALFVDLVMNILQEKKVEHRCNLQSFDIRVLQYIHQNYPWMTISLLQESFNFIDLKFALKELGFLPNTFSPHYSLATPDLIDQVHELNMKFIPWTVNHLEDLKQLIKVGVDGIITDYPNLIAEVGHLIASHS